MTLFVYAVVDGRYPTYRDVFYSENDELAKRHFLALSMIKGTQQFLFGREFDLYYLAKYDTESGHFENCTSPVLVQSGKELEAFKQDYMESLFRNEKFSSSVEQSILKTAANLASDDCKAEDEERPRKAGSGAQPEAVAERRRKASPASEAEMAIKEGWKVC